jgi:hypothetical protein
MPFNLADQILDQAISRIVTLATAAGARGFSGHVVEGETFARIVVGGEQRLLDGDGALDDRRVGLALTDQVGEQLDQMGAFVVTLGPGAQKPGRGPADRDGEALQEFVLELPRVVVCQRHGDVGGAAH